MDDLFEPIPRDIPFGLPSGDGYKTIWNEAWKGYDVHVPGGEFFYAEQFFSRKLSDRIVEYFQENDNFDWRESSWRGVDTDTLSRIEFTNIKWKQDWIKIYGKLLPLPRLTSWYGDADKCYTYSGIKSYPNPWNEGLLHLKQKIEACAGLTFNSVLLNWYRDGNDHLGWHSDDEKELGRNPVIASANFGETRDFVIRRKDNNSVRIVLPMKHGTLLIMRGELQHFWEHSVPKRNRVEASRFNLTFRRIGI